MIFNNYILSSSRIYWLFNIRANDCSFLFNLRSKRLVAVMHLFRINPYYSCNYYGDLIKVDIDPGKLYG